MCAMSVKRAQIDLQTDILADGHTGRQTDSQAVMQIDEAPCREDVPIFEKIENLKRRLKLDSLTSASATWLLKNDFLSIGKNSKRSEQKKKPITLTCLISEYE